MKKDESFESSSKHRVYEDAEIFCHGDESEDDSYIDGDICPLLYSLGGSYQLASALCDECYERDTVSECYRRDAGECEEGDYEH